MPRLFSSPTVLLDPTLHRNGEFRQWIIRSRDIGWGCRVLAPCAITVCGCETLDLALARLGEWTARSRWRGRTAGSDTANVASLLPPSGECTITTDFRT